MKVKSILVWSLLLLIVALVSAFVVNFIVGTRCPININISGTSSAWIAFYGSLWGSLLGALIAYASLRQTRQKMVIDQYQKKYDALKSYLESIMEFLDFSVFERTCLYSDNLPAFAREELMIFAQRRESLTAIMNAWGVAHKNAKGVEGEFNDALLNFYKAYCQYDDRLTRVLYGCTVDNVKECMEELSNMCRDIVNSKTKFIQPLFDKGSEWLSELSSEVNQKQRDLENII